MLYKEVHNSGNIQEVAELISDGHTNDSILYVIRNAVPKAVCETIKDNFNRLTSQQIHDRPDDGYVKTTQIGSSQFAKNGKQYIQATISSAHHVMNLYANLSDSVVRNLFLDQQLEAHFLAKAISYRPARHISASANFATTRRWLDNGEMSLMPHDDTAQLAFASEDGFEIADGKNVIATNLCIADDSEGAELVVWDIRPDDTLREKFQVTKTGYPYPLSFVDQHKKITVKLGQGDLYFLNASYIHGVTSSKNSSRITSGRFMTKIDNKVVYWT